MSLNVEIKYGNTTVASLTPDNTFASLQTHDTACDNDITVSLNQVKLFQGEYEKVIEPLCFTAKEVNSTISMNNDTGFYHHLETSTDLVTWTPFIETTSGMTGTTITLANIGDKVYFRGINTKLGYTQVSYANFIMTGKIEASGNCNSLLDYRKWVDPTANYCYGSLFRNCTSLLTAPQLPSMILGTYAYHGMFAGCTSLIKAPELPALDVSMSPYNQMFDGCTSLTKAPQLPALKVYDYPSMFRGCTSLVEAPDLPATTISGGYGNMFEGCTSLIKAPQLPAMTVPMLGYASMFRGCTSLVVAPELPATTLNSYCYMYMFENCTSLTQAPSTLAATVLKSQCYAGMFKGCTSLTTPPVMSPVTLAASCCLQMFMNSGLVTAPHITADHLATSCYAGMFQNCTSLVTVPMFNIQVNASNAMTDMFNGCSSLYVSSSPVAGVAEVKWRIPQVYQFMLTYNHARVFTGCAGTRIQDNIPGVDGGSYAYFTQNPLV